jgi:hypothetical protein
MKFVVLRRFSSTIRGNTPVSYSHFENIKTAREFQALVLTSTKEQWKNPRAIAGAFRSMNQLRVRDPKVAQMLVEFSSGVKFNEIDLTQTIHTIAKGKQLFKIPEVYITSLQATDFSKHRAQNLALSVYSLAKMYQPNPVVFHKIASAVKQRTHLVGEFKSQDFSNLAWAYATANHKVSTRVKVNGSNACDC